MNTQLRIEYYLLQLDRGLAALPVSQRAEIVTEIKSHIQDVLTKDPQRDVEAILNDLGSASSVAEKYLASKGMTAQPATRRPWLKWLAVGTVVAFALIFTAGLSVIWYFSPILRVDQQNGRVVLLGGLIDVNEKIGRVRVGGLEVNDALKESSQTKGQDDLTDQNITKIEIPFNTAKLDVSSSSDLTMKWDCKSSGHSQLKTEVTAGVLTLNLDSLNLAKCSISLPAGIATDFHGVNGHMEVDAPRDALNISLTNGKVNIRPDASRVYDFEVQVKNGLQDIFPRSSAKDAVKVKVNVVNGLVKIE